MKCGSTQVSAWRKKFTWHSPWLLLMIIFPGLLIYAIVALVVQKKMELNVPLCEEHHGERKRYNIIGGVLLGAILPVALIGANSQSLDGTVVTLVGMIMFLASLIFFVRGGRYIRPTRIDDQQAILAGAGMAFLNALPDQSLGPL